jgi:P4 family phage/plasmid primase-like protien
VTRLNNRITDNAKRNENYETDERLHIKQTVEWLKRIVKPGGVTEVRAIGALDSQLEGDKPTTYVGYYDGDNLERLATIAVGLSNHKHPQRAKAVYFMLNPLKRKPKWTLNQPLVPARSNQLAGDRDVKWRHWLPIDLDPVRASETSATDEEKARAKETARAVRAFLSELGWAEPLRMDSGNGYWLLYHISLPNDDASTALMQRVLMALAQRFPPADTGVNIDQTVFNASRIAKVPGTMARKGKDTPRRPHRRCRLLDKDGGIDVVTRQQLEDLAATVPEASAPEPGRNGSTHRHRLKVEEWLTDRGVSYRIKSSKDHLGRTIYNLGAFPFNSAHTNTDACVMQDEAGKMSANCFHDSCSGKGWKEFKNKIGAPDPHHYDPPMVPILPLSRVGLDEPPDLFRPSGRTDIANGKRIIAAQGDDLRWVGPWKKWLWWDGKRWVEDSAKQAAALGKKVAEHLWVELSERAQGHTTKELGPVSTWCKTSASSRGIANALEMASSEPGIAILPDKLNTHPWLLNCPNGTIDLKTGEMRAHRREDYLTQLCPIEYDPDAKCPRFRQFMDEVFAGDKPLVRYMQRLLGHCLTGDVSEDILPIWWGNGANGKSTLFGVLLHILGSDYSTVAPADILLERRGEHHPTERATLFGKRLVICDEIGQGRRLNEALVKKLTGGDRIDARRMREDYWSFAPTHKLVLVTNHKPEVRGGDHGIWRRLKLVPFTETFSERRKDEQLDDKLMAEAPGILAWLVTVP